LRGLHAADCAAKHACMHAATAAMSRRSRCAQHANYYNTRHSSLRHAARSHGAMPRTEHAIQHALPHVCSPVGCRVHAHARCRSRLGGRRCLASLVMATPVSCAAGATKNSLHWQNPAVLYPPPRTQRRHGNGCVVWAALRSPVSRLPIGASCHALRMSWSLSIRRTTDPPACSLEYPMLP
jgi:hypothetical protein